MRDDSHKWDAPDLNAEIYAGADLTITQIQPETQILVSGVNALTSTALPLVSWPGDCTADGYALVLRRDRILEVSGPARSDGWDDQANCAVSDMSDGYAVITLQGARALSLLKRGGFVNPTTESKSVARLLFGLAVLLYRRAPHDTYVVHVGSHHLQSLKKSLLSCLQDGSGTQQPTGNW